MEGGLREEKSRERGGTKTSSFGVSKRESHDSSDFYSRKLYEGKSEDASTKQENPIEESLLNTVQCIDSRDMSILPDESIHLMVTSPPYNVGKDYDMDLGLAEHRSLLRDVCREVYRKLVVGGRACINVANLGRRPYIPLHSYIIEDMLDIGFLMRGEIIWDKAASAGSSTAWGSWKSATNPVMRDVHEYILVFSKGSMGRSGEGRISTITREEFLEYTKSIWSFPAESATRIGHPAPFPEALPDRLIKFYSFRGQTVLDPFGGSGTVGLVATRLDRHFILGDNSPTYCDLARKRITDEHGLYLRPRVIPIEEL